jgi:hypothetical protein
MLFSQETFSVDQNATIDKNGPEFQGNGAGKHQAQIRHA